MYASPGKELFYEKENFKKMKTEQMVSLFAGYKPTNKFRIGGEFNYMDHLNNANGVKSYGFSVYSVCQMMKKTDLFIRYDRLLYDLNHDENITNIKGDGNTILLGIAYSPLKGINLSLNYQGWNPDDKTDNINNVLLSMEYKF